MAAANRFISGLHVSFLYGQIGMYFLSRFCQLTKGRCFCHEYRQVISRYRTFHFLFLYYQATRPSHIFTALDSLLNLFQSRPSEGELWLASEGAFLRDIDQGAWLTDQHTV